MSDQTTTVKPLGYVKGEICNRDGCTGEIDEYDTDESCATSTRHVPNASIHGHIATRADGMDGRNKCNDFLTT